MRSRDTSSASRHCEERSDETIQNLAPEKPVNKSGLRRFARNDEVLSRRIQQSSSLRGVQRRSSPEPCARQAGRQSAALEALLNPFSDARRFSVPRRPRR
jgi:hypothetical protein